MTGYRKKYSCKTTILRLVENWKFEIDNRRLVGVVSTDMSQAFDSLYPLLIIKKLEANNFSENSLKLPRSYSENTMNRVKIGSVTSIWKTLERGCPQGSTFGPLLRNLLQNDLTYSISSSEISMYADDHQIFAIGNTIEEVKTKLEHDVNTTIIIWPSLCHLSPGSSIVRASHQRSECCGFDSRLVVRNIFLSLE